MSTRHVAVSAGGAPFAWQQGGNVPPPSALAARVRRARPTDPALTWTANDGGFATGYVIERAPDDAGAPGAWAQAGIAPARATSWNDPALDCYRGYWYRVTARTPAGDSGRSPPVRVWTSGILRTFFNVDSIHMSASTGAGDFTKPMGYTPQFLLDSGINCVTSGFMASAIANNASLAQWQDNFHGAAGFPFYAKALLANRLLWLPTGDDLVRTQGAIDNSSGKLKSWGPLAVAEAVRTLAACAFPSGEPVAPYIAMCDESSTVIPPGRPNPPQAALYDITANIRAAAPRLELSWPCDGGTNSTGEAAILDRLRPWQTLPLADFGDVYSAASAWYVTDRPPGYSEAKAVACVPAQAAYVRDMGVPWVASEVPSGGDFGNINPDGSKSVVVGGWIPGGILGQTWAELAYGLTVIRFYAWDDPGTYNQRNFGTYPGQYSSGVTPQVNPGNWAVILISNLLMRRLETRFCGTPQPAPDWGPNFVTAERVTAQPFTADGGRVLWGVNATNSPQGVPGAPSGYGSGCYLASTGVSTDLSPSALAGTVLGPGEVAVFWN